MRALGVDFGLKRVGVAVSDEGGRLARPLAVVPAAPRARLMREFGGFVREYGPAEIVVGDPRRPDGGEGDLGERVRRFAGTLKEAFPGVRVVLVDERYTTFEAEERLKAGGEGNWRRRKRKLDQAAAAVILQDYLDRKGREGGR